MVSNPMMEVWDGDLADEIAALWDHIDDDPIDEAIRARRRAERERRMELVEALRAEVERGGAQ